MVVEMEIPQLEVYNNSALMIKDIMGEFEVKKIELVPFWNHTGNLLAKIPQASLRYIQHTRNGPAEALAGITASLRKRKKRWKKRRSRSPSQSVKMKQQIGANQFQNFFDKARSRKIYGHESTSVRRLQGMSLLTTYYTGGRMKDYSSDACPNKKDDKCKRRHMRVSVVCIKPD
ncbi:hypothetical protein H6P81_002842 [Aristolochia fimbriata]|uniref:RNase H type-1 domain-containing protein n=1 Tax=Aristolochia fimbriata TaxID=158543 RepID=A0AAV7FCN8_ARIFI|nr:hypothetical protein H6P81_002842 [Aristolochia fimbriata]